MKESTHQNMTPFERRAALSMASIYAVRMLGLFMILPVFSLYASGLEGVTPFLVGIAIGIYGMTQAIFQIPLGMLSDRFGRKPVIVAGLLVFALGSAVAAMSDSIYGIIFGRALQGAGAVAAAVAFLQTHPKVGLVYGDANFIDAEGEVIGKFNAQQTSLARLRRGGVYIPQQAAFWRANWWRQVGPLDPSFYFAMDYDLWVRLARVTEIRYIPGQVWANFRLHGDAKTIAADERCWPEMLRVHRRDGGGYLAWIYMRYLARRLLAPVINWRRKRMFAKL